MPRLLFAAFHFYICYLGLYIPYSVTVKAASFTLFKPLMPPA